MREEGKGSGVKTPDAALLVARRVPGVFTPGSFLIVPPGREVRGAFTLGSKVGKLLKTALGCGHDRDVRADA